MTAVVRRAARILVADGRDRVLLHKIRVPGKDLTVWIAPGGGLEGEEDHAAAARRELWEETGLRCAELGPLVWTRRHVHEWDGRWNDQRERYFFVRVDAFAATPVALGPEESKYYLSQRWWTLAEIRASNDVFAPRRLAELLPALLRGDYPAEPIDAGV